MSDYWPSIESARRQAQRNANRHQRPYAIRESLAKGMYYASAVVADGGDLVEVVEHDPTKAPFDKWQAVATAVELAEETAAITAADWRQRGYAVRRYTRSFTAGGVRFVRYVVVAKLKPEDAE